MWQCQTKKNEQHDTNKIRGVFYLLVCLFLFVVVVVCLFDCEFVCTEEFLLGSIIIFSVPPVIAGTQLCFKSI